MTRRAQPGDGPRERALAATIELAEESGVGAITLDAVAARAGLSKGGLLHHFPSKTALLSAMVEQIVTGYYDAVGAHLGDDAGDDDERIARAYVRASAASGSSTLLWTAVLTASLLEPSLLSILRARARALWQEGVRPQDAGADVDADADAAVAWLAADGLWLADMLGLYEITPETRAAVARRLDELLASPETSPSPSPSPSPEAA
jgi:AcrR family transcriptional regulator